MKMRFRELSKSMRILFPGIAFVLLIVFFWFSGAKVLQAGAWVLSGSRWTDKDEHVYSDFVSRLGESKHGNLNKFIRDKTANPLYGEEDQKLNLSADCADFPYLVRAYVAYKLRLPFSYVSAISGRGGDQRYSDGNHPTGFKDHDYFDTPQRMFYAIPLVNSGYYRMAPQVEDGDSYPVKVSRESIKPGTIYYDPNGHVALVYRVTDDGRVRLIDAHPDRTVSRPWFGSKFALGGRNNGGGFRRWRPLWYSPEGSVKRLGNRNIPDFSGDDQYRKSYQLEGFSSLSYFDYVRVKLSNRGGKVRPLEDFKTMLEDAFEDVKYRAEAVNICVQRGISRKSHPGALPWNIYGTDGEWEEFSTPSRDARLKVAFMEVFERTVNMVRMAEMNDPNIEYSGGGQNLASELLSIYDSLAPRMTVAYQNSAGKTVTLGLHDVIIRLFDLSFDPYHSIELRWGAKGEELASAPDDETKRRFYSLERRLRNQAERLYNTATPHSLGPENPPDVDIRAWLTGYLGGMRPSPSTVARAQGTREVPAPEIRTAAEIAPAGIVVRQQPEVENIPSQVAKVPIPAPGPQVARENPSSPGIPKPSLDDRSGKASPSGRHPDTSPSLDDRSGGGRVAATVPVPAPAPASKKAPGAKNRPAGNEPLDESARAVCMLTESLLEGIDEIAVSFVSEGGKPPSTVSGR